MFDKIYLVFAERTTESRYENLVVHVTIEEMDFMQHHDKTDFLPRIYTNLNAAQYDALSVFDGEEVDNSYDPNRVR
jgi:hypothetical protein